MSYLRTRKRNYPHPGIRVGSRRAWREGQDDEFSWSTQNFPDVVELMFDYKKRLLGHISKRRVFSDRTDARIEAVKERKFPQKDLLFRKFPSDENTLAAHKTCLHISASYSISTSENWVLYGRDGSIDEPFDNRFYVTESAVALMLARNYKFEGGVRNPLWITGDWVDEESQVETPDFTLSTEGRFLRTHCSPSLSSEVQSFTRLAWHKMKPRLSKDFSVVNFLLELKDFKFLVKRLRSEKLWDNLKALAPSSFTLQGLSKKAAELHLAWAFAIKPFVSDIQKLYSILRNWETLLRRYIEQGDGTAQSRRYQNHREPQTRIHLIAPEEVLEEYELSQPIADYIRGCTLRRVYEPYKIRASCIYKYSAPALKGFLPYVTAFLDLLGANRNPAIVWNAIPFSFVVDWFYRVGDYLDSYEEQLFGDNYPTLLDFSYTEAYKYRDEIVNGTRVLATIEVDVYDRQKMIPENYSSEPIALGDFTVDKLLLGNSLGRCLMKR